MISVGNNPQQGQENRDPLPNPWSGSTTTPGDTNRSSSTTSDRS